MANADPVLDLGEGFRSDGEYLRSCLSIPVVLGDLLLGVITLFSTEPDRFSAQHQDLVESHVRELVADLGRRTTTLDGVRRERPAAGDEDLQRCFIHGALHGQRVALVVISLPPADLPEVQASEFVTLVDRLIRETVRAGDLTIRTSRDEVVLLLPHTDLAAVNVTAQRIRTQIEQRAANLVLRSRIESFGVRYAVAVSPDDGASFFQLLSAARSSLESRPTSQMPSSTIH
jgi:hypothetical protein